MAALVALMAAVVLVKVAVLPLMVRQMRPTNFELPVPPYLAMTGMSTLTKAPGLHTTTTLGLKRHSGTFRMQMPQWHRKEMA